MVPSHIPWRHIKCASTKQWIFDYVKEFLIMSNSIRWGHCPRTVSCSFYLCQNQKLFAKIKNPSLTLWALYSALRARYTILTVTQSVLGVLRWNFDGKMRLVMLYKASGVSKPMSAVWESWDFASVLGWWSPLTSLGGTSSVQARNNEFLIMSKNFWLCQTVFDGDIAPARFHVHSICARIKNCLPKSKIPRWHYGRSTAP
jgi:hypothetical protein